MKYIISAFFLSAFAAMSFKVSDRILFDEFFKMAYDKSYDGLDKLRNTKTGAWEFERAIGDFDKCSIRFDLERGVHAIDFIMNTQDESTAIQFMTRFEGQVKQAIPLEKYVRSGNKTQSKNIINYNFRSEDPSEKAKNPEISIHSEVKGGQAQMIITLYEPLNKHSLPAGVPGK